jgi:hypothetical protein
VARETAAADRATKAEADYAALREQFRHLRMQLAAAARDLDARQEADAQVTVFLPRGIWTMFT